MSQSAGGSRTREYSPVGPRLKAARQQRGLAQTSVAQRAGLAPSYLSRIENGRVQPTFQTVMQVVRALGADLREIAGPEAVPGHRQGPCPVTARGHCLIDLIAPQPDEEHFSPREIRLLRRFAAWLKSADPRHARAVEALLADPTSGAQAPDDD